MGNDEIRKLRVALAHRQRGRGRRYSANLRQRIGEAAAALRQAGQSWQAIGRFLGIPHETVRWFSGVNTTPAFVPVEVLGSRGGGLSLSTPDGYRVDGLAAAEVAEILLQLR